MPKYRDDKTIKLSKRLSHALRHDPKKYGLVLDSAGWADVGDILRALRMDHRQLTALVVTSDKQRFAFSEDGTKIRANQGHSIDVDLGYEPMTPPEFLYHGTAEGFIASIFEHGLLRGGRHHVHLSADVATAFAVGARHGRPTVLLVLAMRMFGDGRTFFLTPNGVWLTEHVPPRFLERT